ncbi:MAG: hypothetical protein KDC05_04225 [Bacteroidales bacterium]|nr:hypothetical protein [Bacteroidales bacterium]
MIKRSKHKLLKTYIGIILLGLFTLQSFAQETNIYSQVSISDALDLSFARKEISIEKGQLISNVLRIINTSSDSVQFYVTLNYPPQWRTLFNPGRLYTVSGGDSVFVPVRIIPGTLMIGDTKYFINAYIEDSRHRQVAAEYFFASTEKVSSWEMTVNPNSRIYMKNNSSIARFNVGLLNTGNESQEILLTSATASSNVILMDSAGNAVQFHKQDVSLKPREDTSFHYKVKFAEAERNFKVVDIENYRPTDIDDEKQFSVFFHSEEPRRAKYSNASRSSKIDFIKLSNRKKANPYGSEVIPLSAYFRVSNLLEDVVFSSLHLRGQKFLNNGGYLVYNSSFYFSSIDNFYGENYVRNIPWYIGYFDARKNLQLGYVNGGAIGVQSSGKGIKGEIEFIPKHWAGAFYVRTPYFFGNDRLSSYGFHHRYEGDKLNTLTQYAHSHHKFAKLITDVLSFSPRVRVAKKHNINFILSLSNRQNYMDPDSNYSKQGYMVGAGYTSSFFESRWRFNIRGTYTSKGFGAYGYQRFYINQRSRIRVAEHLEMSVNNNYNEYIYDTDYYNYIPGLSRNYYFFNSVNFYSGKYLRAAQPGLFYDIRNHYGYNFHFRGMNLSFNKYDITKNMQASLISHIGLARIINDPIESKEHFVLKLSSMIRYRNVSLTGFYNYGPLSPAMVEVKQQTGIVPQTVRGSFMHTYLFKNRHVVLQSRLSYLYTNVSNHHSLNVSPELFYYTNSGWRFSINPTYTFYTSKIRTNYYEIPSYLTNRDYEFRRTTSDNFQVSLSIKKDFGIPIPGTFKNYSDLNFTAFYDLNGNKIQDDNELGIENVVIKVGNWTVITDAEGNAMIGNADPGNFDYNAFSLVDLKGWFPLITDSLAVFKDEEVAIPFVKGVKIYGSVYIDREEASAMDDKQIDIGGIKISAYNGSAHHTLTGYDGSFEFYLPFGEYTLSLDETVLNGRYYLVKNNYQLDLTKEVENMFITFHIIEKKRKIRVKKFGTGDN